MSATKKKSGMMPLRAPLDRHIQTTIDWDSIHELGILGIDEIAVQKGRQHYVAMVSTQQSDGHVMILAVLADGKKQTVRNFLDSTPERLHRTMQSVCIDMWDAYVYAVHEFEQAHPAVSVNIIIDRFHCTDPIKLDTKTAIVISKQPFWAAVGSTAVRTQQA